MTDYLELSVPVGISGKFIELDHSGALEKARVLWTKYYRLRVHLEGVRLRLSNCNDAAWLFRFADRCRRQGKDFERQLRLLAEGLERAKESLETERDEISSELENIDPSFLQMSSTLAGARLLNNYVKRDAAAKLEAFIASKSSAENTSTASTSWVN